MTSTCHSQLQKRGNKTAQINTSSLEESTPSAELENKEKYGTKADKVIY